MNSHELEEHFQEEYHFFISRQKSLELPKENSSKEDIIRWLKAIFHNALFDEAYKKLILLPKRMEKVLLKDISFLTTTEEIKDHCRQNIITCQSLFKNNRYSRFFSVDNFHNEIFEEETFEFLFDTWLESNADLLLQFIGSPENQDPDILKNILKKEEEELSFLFSLLVKTKILKNKLQSISPTEFNNLKIEEVKPFKSKKPFTRNQVVILLDRLGVTASLEEKTVGSQMQIISDITGFSPDNIKKSLSTLGTPQNKWSKKQREDYEYVNEYMKKWK